MKEIIKDLEHAEKISRIFDVDKVDKYRKAINVLKSSFIVRDWLTGEVRTFDNCQLPTTKVMGLSKTNQ